MDDRSGAEGGGHLVNLIFIPEQHKSAAEKKRKKKMVKEFGSMESVDDVDVLSDTVYSNGPMEESRWAGPV